MPRKPQAEVTTTWRLDSNTIAPERFLEHYRAIKEAKLRKDEAAAAFQAAKKLAKSEGVDLNALKIVEHLSSVEDDEAEIRMLETLRYAAWLGLEVGTQTDLFGGDAGPSLTAKVASQHREWEAEQKGYAAGKAGEPHDNCPYPGGSPLRQRWSSGWTDGQATRASAQGKADE